MDIVLTTDGYKYILIEEHLDIFVANGPKAYIEIYEKWVEDDEMTHYYILVSMSSILQHQLKDYLSVRNMILSVKEMFGE